MEPGVAVDPGEECAMVLEALLVNDPVLDVSGGGKPREARSTHRNILPTGTTAPP